MDSPIRLIRKLLRKIGVKCHVGWRSTHPSGFDIECVQCGEQRSCYMLYIQGNPPEWWETTKSGDESCGDIRELPARWEMYL